MTDTCCNDTTGNILAMFDSVDSDLSVNKIANAYVVKIDGRDDNENWISKSLAVPNVEKVCELVTTWAMMKTNG